MRISDWSSDVCSSDLALGSRIPARFPKRAESARRAARGSPADGSTTSATPGIENYLELIANASQLHNQRVRRLSASRPRLMLARTSRSGEHTSELQSLMRISYAVFCLKKKTTKAK